jgi:hypothetical protein
VNLAAVMHKAAKERYAFDLDRLGYRWWVDGIQCVTLGPKNIIRVTQAKRTPAKVYASA